MKGKKKIVALLMAVLMMVTMLPTQFKAAESVKQINAKLDYILTNYVDQNGVFNVQKTAEVAQTIGDIYQNLMERDFEAINEKLYSVICVSAEAMYPYFIAEVTALGSLGENPTQAAVDAAFEKYKDLYAVMNFYGNEWEYEQANTAYNAIGDIIEPLAIAVGKGISDEILAWNFGTISFEKLSSVIATVSEMQEKIESCYRYDFSVEYYLSEAAIEKYEDTIEYLEENFAGLYTLEHEGDVMAYTYTSMGTFDIRGLFADKYIKTTYSDAGFETYLSLNDQLLWVNAAKDGVDVSGTDLNVAIVLKSVNGGNAVQISYIIKNNGNTAVTYGVASGSDVQIGSCDSAPIYVFDDGTGFKMVSNANEDMDLENKFPQFNFFGKDRKGVVNVDGFWYGHYSDVYDSLFSDTDGESLTDTDSGVTWHWENRTLAAGQSETLSVLIGISAVGEENEVGGDVVIGGETSTEKTDAQKVEAVEKVVKDTLAAITEVSNESNVQAKLEAAVAAAIAADAELEGTTVTYSITKEDATISAAGSISGKVVITSGDTKKEVVVSYEIEKLEHEHTYTWVIVKDATDTTKGEMKGTCSCGESQTKEIPVTAGDAGSGKVTVESNEDNDFKGQLADSEDAKGKIVLTQEEQDAIIAGQDLEIILKLEDINVDVDTTEKEEILEELEGKKLGTFLDINLIKKIGNTETKVTNTEGKIKLTFEVPENLRNTDAKVNRTYTIVRNHEGKVEFLKAEFDKTTNQLTFETDKFSTYAVIYEDTAVTPEAPKTGDTANVVPFILLLSVGCAMVVVSNKKRTVL